MTDFKLKNNLLLGAFAVLAITLYIVVVAAFGMHYIPKLPAVSVIVATAVLLLLSKIVSIYRDLEKKNIEDFLHYAFSVGCLSLAVGILEEPMALLFIATLAFLALTKDVALCFLKIQNVIFK